ncbi:MAG: pectate lyase [Gammaproteobacteria bacterium]|nr:pectate lyase [Gammaproteobacteria bacterium]MBU2059727.1 pectate lyase [Gammaproteobacteria bacterium]MBU2176162.1 pectate lyase [Gammaproteobacteria bacterium]MBU2245350.1 pectate lyase [Gammaproteobacteria bacterium]MBU2344369.1 pectate lyase [Gammaproteobacteria bacterium]
MKLWPAVLLVCSCAASAALLQQKPEIPDRSWRQHQQQSELLRRSDQQHLQHELQQAGLKQALPAVYDKGFGRSAPLPPHQLESAEAQRIAVNILSFQTPSGGWSKRTNVWSSPRQTGQQFGVEPNYVPTFDNDATVIQLHWLAAYYPQAAPQLQSQIQHAVQKGITLVLQAQYPNGGFAQTYPLRGGYHDAVTFNDNVMVQLLTLLHQVATEPQFAFVDPSLKQQAEQQFAFGVQLLLKTQLRLKGKLTIWASQYDPVQLLPIKARAYELPALISSESAAVVLMLMQRVQPSDAVIASVEAAVAWFQQKQIRDTQMIRSDKSVQFVQQKGAKPLWARFYDLDRQEPLFVDRDGRIVSSMAGLSIERQWGYGWYQSNAAQVLNVYPEWKKRIKRQKKQTTDLMRRTGLGGD